MFDNIRLNPNVKKLCTGVCKRKLPYTEEYFQLDMAKVKKGHWVVLNARCKDCCNALKRIHSAKVRKKVIAEYGSTYKKMVIDDPNHLAKCLVREKKYLPKKSARQKKRWHNVPGVKEKHLVLNRKRDIKDKEELTDFYVARIICRNSKTLKVSFVREQKEFIECYRQFMILNRLIKEQNGKTKK